MSPKLSRVNKIKKWLPRLRLFRDRKINFNLFIYSHICIKPENLVKTGPVDLEIIGLTKIVKNK